MVYLRLIFYDQGMLVRLNATALPGLLVSKRAPKNIVKLARLSLRNFLYISVGFVQSYAQCPCYLFYFHQYSVHSMQCCCHPYLITHVLSPMFLNLKHIMKTIRQAINHVSFNKNILPASLCPVSFYASPPFSHITCSRQQSIRWMFCYSLTLLIVKKICYDNIIICRFFIKFTEKVVLGVQVVYRWPLRSLQRKV